MLVEGIGDGLINVHIDDDFLMDFRYFFVECDYTILNLLLIMVLILANKQFVELKIIVVAVSQGIDLDIFEEFGGKLVLIAEFEEMLNSIESFVIVEDEKIFVLLLLRDILEDALRVVGLEEGLVVLDRSWSWRILLGSFGKDGKIVVISGRV